MLLIQQQLLALKAYFFPRTLWPNYRNSYEFTADWFSSRIPLWTRHLKHLRDVPHLNFLEIGTFEGRSALWLMENILTHPTSALTCIDSVCGDIQSRLKKNISTSPAAQQIQLISRRSWEVLPGLPAEDYDFIYIDGDHSEAIVERDAQESWRLLKPGGILIFDDYAWKIPEAGENRPKWAIDRFLAQHEHEIKLLHKDYQVILQKL